VPEKHEQILDACFDLLSDVGYARMSIDAVARRAGVTRPTVYRRWPSKEALAVAALERAQSGIDQLPETEDAAADLVVHLRSLHQTLSRPNGMAIIGTMLAEEHTTPALLDGFRRHVVSPRRAPLRRLIGRAAPLADDDTQDLLVDLLVGAFYARYVAGTPFPTDWAERTVRAVLTGHRPAATTDPTRRP
jgi:AcrR family transcriptional regulator